MSRQPASKSRGDKTGSRGAAAAGAQSVSATVPVSNDIVPGRLTEAEWTRLIAEEEDASFIGNVVDDIIDSSLEKCYEKYIWNQLIPYTVDHAKHSLLQIIEWHFLSRDVGEKNIERDTGWKEDSEPEAGVIDSWAQGSVPVVVRAQSSLAPSVSAISESVQGPPHHPVEGSIGYESEPATTVIEQLEPLAEGEVSPKDKRKIRRPERYIPSVPSIVDKIRRVDRRAPAAVAETKPKSTKASPEKEIKAPVEEPAFSQDTELDKKKKRRVYKKHTGRLPPLPNTDFDTLDGPAVGEMKEKGDSAKPGPEAHLSPSQKSLIKSQAGRPPGNREVTFDERGNVVGVMKLNVNTLPTHKVRVQYAIIDPMEPGQKTGVRFLRAQRNAAKRADKFSAVTKSIDSKTVKSVSKYKSETSSSYKTRDLAVAVQQFPPGMESLVRSQKGSKASVREKKVRGARIDPLPPLLIEAIEASPGVVIQEGEHVKKGPEEVYPNNMTRAMNKSTTVEQGPKLRMVGDTVFRSKFRPVFDPSDVVEVDQQKQSIFAVSSGLRQRNFEQPTES